MKEALCSEVLLYSANSEHNFTIDWITGLEVTEILVTVSQSFVDGKSNNGNIFTSIIKAYQKKLRHKQSIPNENGMTRSLSVS
jgi:hypothetical protein